MQLTKRIAPIATAALLVAFLWGGAAHAQANYSLLTGSGAQAQIGSGLPLPIQIFPGGTMTTTAGTFPPLLVLPADSPPLAIAETAAGALVIPPNVLVDVPTAIRKQATFPTNPAVFEVDTALEYGWPRVTSTLAPGGGPAAGSGVFIGGGPGGGTITYVNSGAAFGGSALFALAGNAALAAGGAIPGQPTTVWINFMGQIPGTGTMAATGAALVGADPGDPQYGATTAAGTVTTAGVSADPGFMGGSFGPAGTVLVSVQCASPCPGLTNAVLGDKGFPWSTGFITVSQPNAAPAEVFYLSGTDTRPGGVGPGNVSLVSGTLSDRALSGPNSNRAWITLNLPEPTAVLGAASALLMLGVCHGAVRRRRG